MTSWTDRRSRFNHLLGIDRYRIVVAWSDESTSTESFDEITPDKAKESAAALTAPGQYTDARPLAVEIRLGQWTAVGSNDCEWRDLRTFAAGAVDAGHIKWTDTAAPAPSPINPDYGQQLTLA